MKISRDTYWLTNTVIFQNCTYSNTNTTVHLLINKEVKGCQRALVVRYLWVGVGLLTVENRFLSQRGCASCRDWLVRLWETTSCSHATLCSYTPAGHASVSQPAERSTSHYAWWVEYEWIASYWCHCRILHIFCNISIWIKFKTNTTQDC